jgi:hypothetical protein
MYCERVRLYFHQRGELPWSVDCGPGTPCHHTHNVVLRRITGRAVYDAAAPGAAGWIELCDCDVEVQDGCIVITG